MHSVMSGDILCVTREDLDGLVWSLIVVDMTMLCLLVSSAVSACGCLSLDRGSLGKSCSPFRPSPLSCLMGLVGVGGGLGYLSCRLLHAVVSDLFL